MKLCSHRPEGFGPSSTISSIPTTCFVDTILIPLPTWMYLLALPSFFIVSYHLHSKNYDPSTAYLRKRTHHRCCTPATYAAYLYYILILANILMVTLELVRLELIHYGISLLPFSYVALLIGAFLHFSDGGVRRISGWVSLNCFLWLGLAVMSAVKTVGLSDLGFDGVAGRRPSKYPVSDQVIDVGVMAGVYVVILALEVALWYWDRVRVGGDIVQPSVDEDEVAMRLERERVQMRVKRHMSGDF